MGRRRRLAAIRPRRPGGLKKPSPGRGRGRAVRFASAVAVAAFGLADAPHDRLLHSSRTPRGEGAPYRAVAVPPRDPAEVPPERRCWRPDELAASRAKFAREPRLQPAVL